MNHLLLLRENFLPSEDDYQALPDNLIDLTFVAPPFSKKDGGGASSLAAGNEHLTNKQLTGLLATIDRVSAEESFLFCLFDGTSILAFAPEIKEQFDIKSIIAWDKGTDAADLSDKKRLARQQDLIVFATKGKRKMASKGHADVVYAAHEGTKPESLANYCLAAAFGDGQAALIFDPLAFHGSTALAAEELGHHSIVVLADKQARDKLARGLEKNGGQVYTDVDEFLAELP